MKTHEADVIFFTKERRSVGCLYCKNERWNVWYVVDR